MRLRWIGLALAVTLAVPLEAHAQVRTAALARMKLLNKKAMEEYDGLEFEAAKTVLLEALEVAQSAGIGQGSPLVTTYLNLGIVFGAGLNDRLGAIKYFNEALRVDRKATLDPARCTPMLEEMWKSARDNLGPEPKPAAGGGLRHTPPDEAVKGRELRIKAKVAPSLGARQILLYYRTRTEGFQHVAMFEDRPGLYVGLIPAEAVAGRALYYYIEAQDEEGQRLDGNGNAGSPNVVALRGDGAGGGGDPVIRRRASSRKVLSITMMMGTGVGVVYGGQSENPHPQGGTRPDDYVDIKPGGALSPFHIAPEIAYHLNDDWQLAGLVRIQVVNATTVRGNVSVLGLLRAKRYFGSGDLRYFLAFGGGGGQVRHRIPLGDYDGGSAFATGDPTPNDIVDSRVAGVGAFAVGTGLRYMFTSSLGLVVEAGGLLMIPQFAAHLDLDAGLVVSF